MKALPFCSELYSSYTSKIADGNSRIAWEPQPLPVGPPCTPPFGVVARQVLCLASPDSLPRQCSKEGSRIRSSFVSGRTDSTSLLRLVQLQVALVLLGPVLQSHGTAVVVTNIHFKTPSHNRQLTVSTLVEIKW